MTLSITRSVNHFSGRSLCACDRRFRPSLMGLLLVVAIFSPAVASVSADEETSDRRSDESAVDTTDLEKAWPINQWKPLFNGKDLDGWKVTNFGGEGEIFVEKGQVVINEGADLSGIHTKQLLPHMNYEVEFEAQRESGTDFFVGMTFPVRKDSCSLIMGGWGGGVCGLSSLDGMDASENETTWYQAFDNGVWYKVRLQVRPDKIIGWLDGEEFINADIRDRRIGVRFEVEGSRPFGFATWQTTGRLRNVRLRRLPEDNTRPAKTTRPEDK